MMRLSMIIVAAFLLPILTTAQDWIEHTVDDNFRYANFVHAADIDGDGDCDILGAAQWAHTISWWDNTDGYGNTWIEHIVSDDFQMAFSVNASDVDGDGDLDILGAALGLGDDMAWWENVDGHGLVWAEHIISEDFNSARIIYGIDMDEDGDVDILGAAGGDTNQISWWENIDGSGLVWDIHLVVDEYDGIRSVYPQDMDGDSDLDILSATAGSHTNILWWENTNGDGIIWESHLIDWPVGGPHSVYAADMDRDGDIDVLCAARVGDDIIWWENSSEAGIPWYEHTIDGHFNQAISVFAVDIDSDGDLDVLGAAASESNNIAIWENTNGHGTAWDEHTLAYSFSGATSVYATDIDGDTDIDILGAAGEDHEITWWENPLILSVDEISTAIFPDEYALNTVYPNPFNPTTTISVELPAPTILSVLVYNVTGQQVAELANGHFNAGTHALTFDASGMASGLYFLRATVPGQMDEIQKVMLVR
jgi:FG-GAP-like repeat/Secretion system C-terminal sorting domain